MSSSAHRRRFLCGTSALVVDDAGDGGGLRLAAEAADGGSADLAVLDGLTGARPPSDLRAVALTGAAGRWVDVLDIDESVRARLGDAAARTGCGREALSARAELDVLESESASSEPEADEDEGNDGERMGPCARRPPVDFLAVPRGAPSEAGEADRDDGADDVP